MDSIEKQQIIQRILSGEVVGQLRLRGLCDDKDFAMALISTDTKYLDYTSKTLKNNKDIAMVAVKKDGATLSKLGSNLRADIEVVKEALITYPPALMMTSGELKDNEELVLYSMECCGDKYSTIEQVDYASTRIQDLCKGQDNPLKFLKAHILAKRLQGTLHLNKTAKTSIRKV